MSEQLYHGSIYPDIQTLQPLSKLHNDENNVVYLTDNVPYALFYIWDGRRNKKNGKHVTAWIKNGVAYYEEQFPNQMKTFYDGVKGYLYSVDSKEKFSPVTNRESMYSCGSSIPVDHVVVIENVYETLLRYEAKDELIVIRYEDVPKERIEELYDHMAGMLVENKVTENPDSEEAIFYQEYFKAVWDHAVGQK